jgi:hypothetical protein
MQQFAAFAGRTRSKTPEFAPKLLLLAGTIKTTDEMLSTLILN